jgi:hypothetical protein
MRGLRVQSFLGQNTLQPPQKQRHLVHRNTDDVSRDWPDHKVFFRTGGDIGQRVAHHARLSGKPSPISTRRRLFHVALAALRRGPKALPARVSPASVLACSSALARPVSSDASRTSGFALFPVRLGPFWCVWHERRVMMAAWREPEQFENPDADLLLRLAKRGPVRDD